ncbi:MAG: flavodoxin family protein [Acidimicrobiales bacterium]
MNVAVLFQSLRGGTERAAHSLAEGFADRGHEVGVYPVTRFNAQFVLNADLIVLGTWTDGLFGLGAKPGQMSKLRSLPPLAHMPIAAFVTYEISPTKSLDKLVGWLRRQEANVVAEAGFSRRRLTEGMDDFVTESLAGVDDESSSETQEASVDQ